MEVPGKFDVSALGPAIELKRVLFPQFGCPTKTTTGTLGRSMVSFDDDLLGHAATQSDLGAAGQVPDEEGTLEERPRIQTDEVSPMEAEGEQPPPEALPAHEVFDPQRNVGRRVEKCHESPLSVPLFRRLGHDVKRDSVRTGYYKRIGMPCKGGRRRRGGNRRSAGF
jgi:hypothetical protein